MSTCKEISDALINGNQNAVRELVQKALDEGLTAEVILHEALISGMDVVGEKFRLNEFFVPNMLISARAMQAGMEILKAPLSEAGIEPIGRAVIGTVKGDLHDIGKNLVRLMMEGKGIEVMDLGVDVSAEQFLEAHEVHGINLIACSALLTTTMGEMKNVVDLFTKKGLRDKVTIMIGGAPISDAFCKSIGADYYTADAASAAEVAKNVLLAGK